MKHAWFASWIGHYNRGEEDYYGDCDFQSEKERLTVSDIQELKRKIAKRFNYDTVVITCIFEIEPEPESDVIVVEGEA